MRTVALAVVFAAAAATVAVVRTAPELSLAGESTARLAAEVVAATLPVIAIAAASRPRFGMLLAAATVAWLAAEWSSPGAGALFTLGLLLYATWPALLAAAALRGLGERPVGRVAIGVVGFGALAGAGVLGLASAALFDPVAEGCAICPANHLRVADAPGAVHALGHAGLGMGVAFAAAFLVPAPVRLARASPARRRLDAPVLVSAALAIGAFGADAAHGLARGYLSSDATDRALRLAQAGALALLAAGIALERLRLHQTRARMARLVLDIGAAPAPGELRARLADSLGDPGLRLLHPAGGGWIDEHGCGVALPPGATRLTAAGEDVLAVVHRPGLLDDPQPADELATTARLAVEHERLQAAHRARLAELRASRQRIVAAADRERRALERDLHDGAQQRLVTLGLSIRLARRAREDDHLARAEAHAVAAAIDLRKLAHGLFPTVLADEGLAAALDALSEQVTRLHPRNVPDGRFPAAVESAAYFAACEVLRLTEDEVTIDGRARNGSLHLAIGAEVRPEITEIEDRVGAVGGTVAARSGRLLLEIPCES
jgi:signal transduction histidine kinase